MSEAVDDLATNESACLRLVCLDISASSDSGGIAQLVERLVRKDRLPFSDSPGLARTQQDQYRR